MHLFLLWGITKGIQCTSKRMYYVGYSLMFYHSQPIPCLWQCSFLWLGTVGGLSADTKYITPICVERERVESKRDFFFKITTHQYAWLSEAIAWLQSAEISRTTLWKCLKLACECHWSANNTWRCIFCEHKMKFDILWINPECCH